MAGEHQGHQLVADLLVGEPLPRLVANADQEAEDVHPALVTGGAALGDLGVDDLVEHRPRARHLRPGRAGAAQQAQVEVGAVEAERALEVIRCGSALAGLVGIEPEQGAHRDPHRQPAHPLVDVDHLALAQPLDRRRRLGDHRLDRGRDLLAVEGGHHDRPGAVVVGVVDRQQAVAEQRDQVAEARLAPVEVLRVGDGDEVVGLGAEHEDHRAVQQPHAEDRPVLLVEAEQHRQRVARRLQGPAEAEVLRSRGVGAMAAHPRLGPDVVEHANDRVGAELLRRRTRAAELGLRLGAHAAAISSWLTSQLRALGREAASWPQAASMSRPRVRRTVAVRWCSARIARKRSICSGGEPS